MRNGKGGFRNRSVVDEENRAPDRGFGGKGAAKMDYSQDALDDLLFMLEEEKLAGDLYESFAGMYGLRAFDRIARSEDRHFNKLLKQAEKFGLDTDAFVFQPAGTYVNKELQTLHDNLLAQGSLSLEAALGVGVAIEKKDIDDLAEVAQAVEGTALERVYLNLLQGSENHLAAFESLL